MSTRKAWYALLALCLAMILSGCWQAEEPPEEDTPVPVEESAFPEPETPSTLPERFALPWEPEQTLDPLSCPDGMQRVVASLIYEGLFRLDPRMEPEPCLCESWSRNDDATAYTFVLREGVMFSDGSPLTSSEVLSALERAKQSDRYRARLRQIDWMGTSGKQSLIVTLSAPNTALPALLDIPVSKPGGDAPLGTGPYAYLREDYASWLAVNPLWWRGGGQPVDRILLRESQGTMLYRFASRDVQLIVEDLTGSSPAGLTGDIRYQDAPTTTLQYIVCNTEREPLNNTDFRRALHQGLNRENLVNALLSGHAMPAQFPLSPASPLYPADLEETYSPLTFSGALSWSGYAADSPLSLLVNGENSFKVSVAQSIARNFSDAGLSMEARVLPWEEYQQAVAERDFDLCYCESRLTADWNLIPLLASWGELNIGGWYDEWMEHLMDVYAAADDRAAAMRELCEHFRNQVPILPVCFDNSSILMRPDVVEHLIPTAAEPFYNLPECVIHLRAAD